MLTIMGIDVGLAIAMQASGDVAYEETDLIYDEFDRVVKREFRCAVKGSYTTVFFAANIFILGFLALLCYQDRTISVKFSESKYISMAVASALQITGLGFLLIVLSENTPTVDYLMISLMTIITDGSTLFFIFVPKMQMLQTHHNAISDEKGMEADTYASNVTGDLSTVASTN
jgi:hypothetical protein